MWSVKISFLIPSKNRLSLLKSAISSILRQGDQQIEIVVSDNASHEDYAAYIRGLNDSRIVYDRLSEPVSVTENWQNALRLATGDYILMLGDDDAVVPGFFERINPLLDGKPDVVYLAAFHYAYPGVLSFKPSGYLAVVRNAEFLLSDVDPFCLTKKYQHELANSVLDFRYRFGFNAQHFLLRADFVKSFAAVGSIYQSPYPDTFSAVVVLSNARSVVVMPTESVIIGISPKSFGAYYFSNRHAEGYDFLANGGEEAELREQLRHEILPGDQNNTNWLIAIEATKRMAGAAPAKAVNMARYRALQIKSVLQERYLYERVGDDVVEALRAKLPADDLELFALLESAISAFSRYEKAALTAVFSKFDADLAQFTKARIAFLDIGDHQNVDDALLWLRGPGQEWAKKAVFPDEKATTGDHGSWAALQVLIERKRVAEAQVEQLRTQNRALLSERNVLREGLRSIDQNIIKRGARVMWRRFRQWLATPEQ